jgi:hypothetical protein
MSTGHSAIRSGVGDKRKKPAPRHPYTIHSHTPAPHFDPADNVPVFMFAPPLVEMPSGYGTSSAVTAASYRDPPPTGRRVDRERRASNSLGILTT